MIRRVLIDSKNQERRAPRFSPYIVGVALISAAAVLWSLNGALIKIVNQKGAGPDGLTIAFYRSAFAGLFLLPFAFGKFQTLRESTINEHQSSNFASVILCVICFALMTTTFVVANTKTAAANVIILQYTSTFWVFGLSPVFLGERASRRDSWILLLAMAGIAVIFAGNAQTDGAGLAIALAAGLFYGLLTMILRKVRNCDSAALTVANNFGTSVLLLPAVLAVGTLLLPWRTVCLLVFMGAVQFGLPYYFFSLGLQRVPAYRAALITMAEPILVPVWTYLAVKEPVPPATILGGTVILLALALFLLMRGGSSCAHGKE